MKAIFNFLYSIGFYQSIRSKPLLSFSILFALSLHFIVFIFSLSSPAFKQTPHRQKLHVKTHLLPEQKFLAQFEQSSSITSKTSQKKISPSKKQSKHQSAKTIGQQDAKKKSTSLTNEQAKKLLSDLQNSLAKIETTKEKESDKEALFIPQSIKELKTEAYHIETESSQTSIDYERLLIDYLKSNLQLPAYGKVKILLSLSSSGLLEALEIVFSDSEINRFYLEKNLKELQFPEFSHEIQGLKSYTFNLTFCSD